jgi:hypothetical protein
MGAIAPQQPVLISQSSSAPSISLPKVLFWGLKASLSAWQTLISQFQASISHFETSSGVPELDQRRNYIGFRRRELRGGMNGTKLGLIWAKNRLMRGCAPLMKCKVRCWSFGRSCRTHVIG